MRLPLLASDLRRPAVCLVMAAFSAETTPMFHMADRFMLLLQTLDRTRNIALAWPGAQQPTRLA
jgi:hypothetical protein